MDPTADDLDEIADRLEASHFELLALLAEIERLVVSAGDLELATAWLTAMRGAVGRVADDQAVAGDLTLAGTVAVVRARAVAAADRAA